MDAVWQALAREAALASEEMALGATTVSTVDHNYPGRYYQMFFALSIGFERASKLILVVDQMVATGTAPTAADLKAYGHRLDKLLLEVDRIATRRALSGPWVRLPNHEVHQGIVSTLNEFASNLTRYYNLEYVSGSLADAAPMEPIAAWHRRVTMPVFDIHVSERRKRHDEASAAFLQHVAGDFARVRRHGEGGEELNSLAATAQATAISRAAAPWSRMYVLQLCRFLGAVASGLGQGAMVTGRDPIPYLADFFRVFENDDRTLRGRKTWAPI